VLQSIFVFQERLGQTRGQGPWDSLGQHAEQRPASMNPAECVLRDLRAQAPANEIANGESGESAIPIEVGPQHRSGEPDAGIGQRLLKPCRWQVDDGDRVADQRQRRTHAFERLQVVGDGEMTRLPTRGRAQLRKVGGEPLLQLARTR
jgi:hypothetical protein